MTTPASQLQSALEQLKRDPTQPEPWELASYLLISHKKWGEACSMLALAVNAFPDRATLHSRYALALDKTGKLTEAYQQVGKALALQPDLTEALMARIEILSDAGHYDLALQDSLKLSDKNIPETAAFSQGALAFMTGDMTRGMKLITSVLKSGWRGKDLPEWDQLFAKEKHILLYNTQAFGDLIQFSRYIDRARASLGKVTLQIPSAMERFVRDSFPDLEIILEGEAVPDNINVRYALTSLAIYKDVAFDPWPNSVPYIRADPTLAAPWRERLAHMPRPRIGIVWSSPWQMNNPFRVVDFAALKPLVDIAGPHLVSLQMGEAAQPAIDAGLFDAAPFIKDFADSAALISELDLIISLDSAPAHMAGALGKPVWLFLPFNAEWRWLIGRDDSIWYPSMRIFRQAQPQGWSDVFHTIATELKRFVAGDASVLQPKAWEGLALKRHPGAFGLPGLKV